MPAATTPDVALDKSDRTSEASAPRQQDGVLMQAGTSSTSEAQEAPEPTSRQLTPDEEADTDEDDLDLVHEAEAELHLDRHQLLPGNGELPEFLRDDKEEFEEDVDDTHQRTVFG